MNQPPQPGQPEVPGAGDWMLDTPVPAALPDDGDPEAATELAALPSTPPSLAEPPGSFGGSGFPSAPRPLAALPSTPPSLAEPPVFDYPDSGYGPGYLPYPAAPTGLPYDSEEPPVSYGAVPLPGAPVVAGGPGAVAPAWGYPGAPEEKPARKSRRKWVIAAVTVLIVALVGGGIAAYQVFFSGKADREAVGVAATDFTRAVVGGDVSGVKGLLCGAEAASVPDVAGPSGASGVSDADVQVTLGEVQVRKELASAVVARGSDPDATLYLRKEGGAWKVCAAAKGDFDSAAK